MLTRSQIEVLARRFGVGLAVQERDYVQHIFLYLLNKNTKALTFKGGTCLKIAYNSLRYSEDLDFNCDLERDILEVIINRSTEELSTFGVDAVVKNHRFFKDGFTCDLSFRGVRFNGRDMAKNKIRIDISLRKEKIVTYEKMLDVGDAYLDIPRFILVCSSLKDILAEKVRALIIRGKPRDLWDVWFFLEKGESLDLDLINSKLRLYDMEFNKQHIRQSIENLQKDWVRDLSVLLSPGQLPDFEKVREKCYSVFEK